MMDYNRLAEALSVIFSKREGMDIRIRVITWSDVMTGGSASLR